jgi:hypothetical protein
MSGAFKGTSADPRSAISIESRPTTGRRWRSRSLGSTIAWLAAVFVNTARLGVEDHLWPLAIAIDVALVIAIPLLTVWLRRRDASLLAAAPPGTLYVGGTSLTSRQFTRQSGLARFLSGTKFRQISGGWLSGRLTISDVRLLIEPGRFFGRGLLPVSIDWDQVRSIDVTRVPGKVNVGSLHLRLVDGSTLSLQARGHNRLQAALARVARCN